jgi:hypothetical protein
VYNRIGKVPDRGAQFLRGDRSYETKRIKDIITGTVQKARKDKREGISCEGNRYHNLLIILIIK